MAKKTSTPLPEEIPETPDIPTAEMPADMMNKPVPAAGQVIYCSLEELAVDEGFNVRMDYGEDDGTLDELTASIIENGIKTPLKGFFDTNADSRTFEKIVIIDGHRRRLAGQKAKELAEKEIAFPVFLEETTITLDERLFEMAFAGGMGKKLSQIEMAEIFKRLTSGETGMVWSVQEIADKTGFSHSYVSSTLTLANAPEKTKEAVRNKQITPTAAVTVARKARNEGKSDDDIDEEVAELIEKAGKKGKKTASNQEIDDEVSENFAGAPEIEDDVPEMEEPTAEYPKTKDVISVLEAIACEFNEISCSEGKESTLAASLGFAFTNLYEDFKDNQSKSPAERKDFPALLLDHIEFYEPTETYGEMFIGLPKSPKVSKPRTKKATESGDTAA